MNQDNHNAGIAQETVWANYRYTSAWNEVNVRIAQRQNALNIFVTLATGIVTIMLVSRSTMSDSKPLVDPKFFSLLLPIVSLSFGLLNYKHDRTIAILRQYLAMCEEKHEQDFDILGYNSSKSPLKKLADSTRRFHDISCAALLILFNGVGFFTARAAYPVDFEITRWPVIIYWLFVIIACGLVLRSTVRPYTFDNVNIGRP